MRQPRGYVRNRNGYWIAQVSFYDATGRRKIVERHADPNTKTAAIDLKDELLRDIRATRGEIAKRSTFAELAAYYKATFLKAPVYQGDAKVSGLRSHKSIRSRLALIEDFFGTRRIGSITWDDCNALRDHLLAQTTRRKGLRSVTDVNRIMEVGRRVFRVAVTKGWLVVSPMAQGDSLISKSDENHRDRILSPAEERKLLKKADPWLRDAIIILLDTGLRSNELRQALVADVDLRTKTLRVSKRTSKTEVRRLVPLTDRVIRIVKKSAEKIVQRADVYHPFRELANSLGMTDLRLHDLRHTCGTRLAQGGMSLAEIARILGHSQVSTTFRYLNVDAGTFQKARKILRESVERRDRSRRPRRSRPAPRPDEAPAG